MVSIRQKVSHMYNCINSMIVDNIEEKFGKLSPTTGKKHTFLGMDIEFIGGKKVSLTKPHCINKVLEDLGKTLKENVVNLATSQLFTITN